MSNIHTNETDSHLATKSVFPLPFYSLPRLSPSFSRRVRARSSLSFLTILVANLMIFSLNSLYLNVPLPVSVNNPSISVLAGSSECSGHAIHFLPYLSALFSNSASNLFRAHAVAHLYNNSDNISSPAIQSTYQTRLCDSIMSSAKSYLCACRRTLMQSGLLTTHEIISIYIHVASSFDLSMIRSDITLLQDHRLFSIYQSHQYYEGNKQGGVQSPIDSGMGNGHVHKHSVEHFGVDIPYEIPNLGFPSPMFYDRSLPAIPIISSRVSLPAVAMKPIPMLSLLPADMMGKYCGPAGLLSLLPTKKKKTPRFFGLYSEYVLLLTRLHSLSMVSFTNQPKCVNGMFGVIKPDDKIRMIIDATHSNGLFSQPDKVKLPTPTHFSHLVDNENGHIYVSKTDLSNFYHSIGLPSWLCPYFCLPPIKVVDLPRHILHALPDYIIRDAEYIYPMCLTLPMGWAHSVLIAQIIHECILYNSNTLRKEDNILNVSHPYLLQRVLHALYIDDAINVGKDKEECMRIHRSIIEAYEKAGFMVNMDKVQSPTCEDIQVLGMVFNGREKTIRVSCKTQMEMIVDTIRLIQRGKATGIEMSRLLGKWTWAILLRRPLFSSLQHIYRFINIAKTRVFSMWPSVKRELLLLICLAPFLQSSFSTGFSSRVIASDASMDGFGIVSAALSNTLTNPTSADTIPFDCFSNWWLSSYSPVLHHSLVPNTNNSRYTMDSVIIPHNVTFSTIISQQWKYKSKDHINKLEMRAVDTSIRWYLSYPESAHARVLLLTDNQSVYYSLRKGRSSSSSLLSLLRRISALLLSGNLIVQVAWVQSDRNPADAPSRSFQSSDFSIPND
jgi:hypothetical protein